MWLLRFRFHFLYLPPADLRMLLPPLDFHLILKIAFVPALLAFQDSPDPDLPFSDLPDLPPRMDLDYCLHLSPPGYPDLACPDLACPDLACPDPASPDPACPDPACPDPACRLRWIDFPAPAPEDSPVGF